MTDAMKLELIEEVKKYSVLYNRQFRGMFYFERRREAWRKIGKKINTTGEIAQKRWQGIRNWARFFMLGREVRKDEECVFNAMRWMEPHILVKEDDRGESAVWKYTSTRTLLRLVEEVQKRPDLYEGKTSMEVKQKHWDRVGKKIQIPPDNARAMWNDKEMLIKRLKQPHIKWEEKKNALEFLEKFLSRTTPRNMKPCSTQPNSSPQSLVNHNVAVGNPSTRKGYSSVSHQNNHFQHSGPYSAQSREPAHNMDTRRGSNSANSASQYIPPEKLILMKISQLQMQLEQVRTRTNFPVQNATNIPVRYQFAQQYNRTPLFNNAQYLNPTNSQQYNGFMNTSNLTNYPQNYNNVPNQNNVNLYSNYHVMNQNRSYEKRFWTTSFSSMSSSPESQNSDSTVFSFYQKQNEKEIKQEVESDNEVEQWTCEKSICPGEKQIKQEPETDAMNIKKPLLFGIERFL